MINKITKILILVVLSYIMNDASAQSKMNSNDRHYPAVSSQDPISTRVESNLFKKGSYSGWFFPTAAITSVGVTFAGYVDFITTDSNVRMVTADGTSYFNGKHLVGVCFDPKDENFGNEVADGNGGTLNGVNLSKFNPYKVDTIYFTYQYVRKLDSAKVNGIKVKVVDTLIFQFHNPGNMKFSSFAGPPSEKYGFPKNFTRSIGGSTGAAYTEKVPLTDADSTTVTALGWRSKGMQIAIPASVAQAAAGDDNNQVGFNIFFKQMIPNQPGDTMEARNGAIIKNPVNYFGYSERVNEDLNFQVNQEIYRNNSYYTYNKQLYGGNINGWVNYIAGNAFFKAPYMYCAFHLTTPNLKATDINKNGYGIGKIVPNPAQAGQDVNIEFSLGNSERVTLTVSDLLGKTLKTITTDKLNAGYNYITFNTANLTPGVYFYTLTSSGFKASRKFTVTN